MAAAEAVALLEALREQVAAVTEHGRELLRRVRGGRLRTEKGVSLLGVGAQALLQYLQDLGLLLGDKARGRSLAGGAWPALPRLLETRVVLEKLRPLEHRLKYQLEKLLRAGGRGDNDPLRFRPDPENMAQEEEAEPEGGAKAPGLGGGRRYVPPRLVPVTFDPEGAERAARAQGAGLRRALGSALLRELRQELGEGPTEEPATAGEGTVARGQRWRQRQEEAWLHRLPRERGRGRRRAGAGLDDITHFGDVSALLDPTNQEAPPPRKRAKVKRKKLRGRGFRRRR